MITVFTVTFSHYDIIQYSIISYPHCKHGMSFKVERRSQIYCWLNADTGHISFQNIGLWEYLCF